MRTKAAWLAVAVAVAIWFRRRGRAPIATAGGGGWLPADAPLGKVLE
jgi:hypothetical protein